MKIFISTSLLFLWFSGYSQSESITKKDTISSIEANQVLIEEAINNLFEGMRTGDSSMVKDVLHEDIRLQTTYISEDGSHVIRMESSQQFITVIGTSRKDIWNEEIDNLIITVDGPLGQAWMDYSFYLNEDFSHCGVNAMQFFFDGNAWKIVQIIDTRRRSDCNKKSDPN